MDIQQRNLEAAHELAIQLKADNDYVDAKVLPDGSVACLVDLIFTRAIILGCTKNEWSRRFCFEDRSLATLRYEELQSEDDEPQGYVARR